MAAETHQSRGAEQGSQDQSRFGRSNILIAAVATAFGLGVTMWVAQAQRNMERSATADRYRETTHDYLSHVNLKAKEAENALLSLKAFFESSNNVDRDEFGIFVNQIKPGISSVRAYEWAPHVTNQEREEFEHGARQDGLENYTILESDPVEGLVPSAARREYFPVLYCEPVAGNEKIFGYDLSSEQLRQNGLHRSIAANSISSTEPLHLKQDEGVLSVLISAPVYPKGSERETVGDRATNLLGFVIGVVDIQSLLPPLQSTFGLKGNVTTAITAGVGSDVRVLAKVGEMELEQIKSGQSEGLKILDKGLWVGDQSWHFQAYLNPNVIASVGDGVFYAILMVGTLMTALLVGYVRNTQALWTQQVHLEETNHALERRNQEIQRFYHAASHELKTPLTAAREFSSLLIDEIPGSLNEDQSDYLGYILESCDQLTRYINDMLDLSRMETGKLAIQPEPTDLNGLLTRMLDVLEPSIAKEEIHLVSQLPDDLPLVMADEQRICQVLGNLVNNSVKFTPPGGVVTVTARVHPTDSSLVEVSVRDTGIGIEPEDQAHVFERLFQTGLESNTAQDSNSRAGLGLGLSICREIVHLHNGTISVDSAVDEGSTFTFTLHSLSKPAIAGVS